MKWQCTLKRLRACGARVVICLMLFTAPVGMAGAQPGPGDGAVTSTAREPIVYYDMTGVADFDTSDPRALRRYYDETFLVTSLQGLANRERPRLFVRANAKLDDFWWARMREDDGAWLAGREVVRPGSLGELLGRFKGDYRGVVVWDERVPATSNLASTIAGAEGLLVVRYDERAGSVYQEFVGGADGLRVVRRLMAEDGSPLFTGAGQIAGTSLASTGSAKNDAYRWLIENYIKAGKVNPQSIGFYLDGFWLKSWQASDLANHTVNNHDYVIAHRGVLVDLNVWEDETPVDDRGQKPGTDLETFKLLLRACYEGMKGRGMIHAAGFTPWGYKYTRDQSNPAWNPGGKHGGVETEWKYAEMLTCFNAYMDADALAFSSMVNASFYQHYPLPEVIAQNPRPTREGLIARGILDAEGNIVPRNYYAHYQGDYDSAAWLYQRMPEIWTDPERGKAPMTWAINPNLAERFAFGMHWIRRTATANDFFIAGDSGAGYLNPRNLSEPRPSSGLPGAVAEWEAHCARFYKQWDITLTGFVIDGNAPFMTEDCLDAYARFSPDGVVFQGHRAPLGLHDGVPFTRMMCDLPYDGDPKKGAAALHDQFLPGTPNFIIARTILRPPGYYLKVERELEALGGPESMLVDAYTLMWLIREYETRREFYARRTVYGQAGAVEARPGRHEGLFAVRWADITYTTGTIAGRACWTVPATEKGAKDAAYLWFRAHPDFNYLNKGGLAVEVSYLDRGEGSFGVQYDVEGAAGNEFGIYRDAPVVIKREGSGGWKTVTFELPGARFQNRLPGFGDFRLWSKGDGLAIGEVTVRRPAR